MIAALSILGYLIGALGLNFYFLYKEKKKELARYTVECVRRDIFQRRMPEDGFKLVITMLWPVVVPFFLAYLLISWPLNLVHDLMNYSLMNPEEKQEIKNKHIEKQVKDIIK